jgi:signal peptidase I
MGVIVIRLKVLMLRYLLPSLCFFPVACRTAGQARPGVEEAEVRGDSLSPLLKAGDGVRIYYGYYDNHEVQRGDIVVCRVSFSRDPLIKIAHAVPGDRFALQERPDGVSLLLVNGAVLENSAGQPYEFTGRRKRMLGVYAHDYGGVIPSDSYLLLGDAAEGSLDSGRFGLAAREVIVGKAVR